MANFKQTVDGRGGLPQNLDAERSVLGALLLSSEAVDDVRFLRATDFYEPRHQLIFQAIVAAHASRHATDPIVVGEELSRVGKKEEAGGDEQLLDLMECVTTSARVAYHADLVRDKATLRQLAEAGTEIVHEAMEPDADAKIVLDSAHARLQAIAPESGDAISIVDGLEATFARIDRLRERDGRLTGLGTDYYDFDDMTGGLHPGELIVIGARPSMGKTTLAINIMERTASMGNPVAFFALEMSNQQVIQNLLACRAQIDGQAMRRGRITDTQYKRLREEAAKLSETPIFIDDTPGLTINQIRKRVRRLVRKHGIRLLIVDHMQLMSFTGRFPDRYAEQAAIVVGLKTLAREYSIPVILISCLNRGPEDRDDHRPRLSDLRDCGTLEDAADVVVLLHRDDYYRPTEQNAGLAQLIIAKQRNGPTGEIVLRFFREYMRFENYTRRAEPVK